MAEVTDEVPDRETFVALYAGLRAFASATRSPGMDPDDLVQEALTQALGGGPLARLEHPGAYLRRAILHLASNDRRRFGRAAAAFRMIGATEAHLDVYGSDSSDVLRLKPLDRAVLWLLDVERWPSSDVAKCLGLSDPAVRKRASRARARLRRLIGEDR